MTNKNIKVGFVGLTHLGLNYLAATSTKNFSVVGFDENYKKINELKSLVIDVKEPGLLESIKKNIKKISFTNNFYKLKYCNVVFISKDTSTDKHGNSNFEEIEKIIYKTIKYVKKNTTIVVLSQVLPGYIRGIKYNKDRLFCQVETLVFGEALERSLHPERIVVGLSSITKKISKNYETILKKFNCPIIKMSYESAELSKISINLFLASSINLTNHLDKICEKLNLNWDDIKKVLKTDKRIGKNAYLKPGLGISGGNLERDINNIIKINKKLKLNNNYFKSLISSSNERKKWVWNKFKLIKKNFNKKINITILGLAYKENTNSTKNSPAIELIKKLKNKNKYSINVYDPRVEYDFKQKNLKIFKSIPEALENTDMLFVLTSWGEFKKINNSFLKKFFKGQAIIDPFKSINYNKLENSKIKYFSLGGKI